jgi:hypothetical protein
MSETAHFNSTASCVTPFSTSSVKGEGESSLAQPRLLRLGSSSLPHFFSESKFEFSQFFKIIFSFSTFSQRVFEIGLWKVRLSRFYRQFWALVACGSLPRLIFNEIFLGISM